MIVNELKSSILQSAFEGKITKKIDSDKDVNISLLEIKKQKEQLIEKYNVKREPSYKDVAQDEKLFEIPSYWKWIRIGELGVFKKGPFGSALTKSIFVKESDDAIKIYEQKNAIQKDITLGDYYISKDYFEKKMKSFEVSAGDILVSCAGTIGETYVVPESFKKGIINQALMRMTMVKELNIDYFLLYFDFILKKISNNLSNGAAIKNIPPFDVFKQLIIPYPPLEEQKRIVDEINSIFSKLNDVKDIETELYSLKKAFPNEMRKSILKSAIEGKLTYQNENDNSAFNMIEKSILLKEEAIKQKKSKKTYKEDKTIKLNFDIPLNWTKVSIGKITDITSGGTPSRSNTDFWGGDIPWLKIGDLNGKYVNESSEYITEKGLNNSSAKWFEPGTILYTIFATIGTVSILNIRATTNQAIAGLTLYGDIDKEYFYYVCLALKDVLVNKGRGCAQLNINQEILSNVEIPIPPLEEQKRIVDKIEQLLPLCDEIDNLVN